MGALELPREYRPGRGGTITTLIILALKSGLFLFIMWTEELFSRDVMVWVSVALALFVLPIMVRAPWTVTVADHSGIRHRGIFLTRRIPWTEIEDIRVATPRGPGNRANPYAYAYLTGGKRKLLMHVGDGEAGLAGEVAFLRAALARSVGTDPVPDTPAA
ncbi:PH domain-containing protein [Streptomyces sp. NPDC006512]|uniref:PH domain-containing protein n=1 Tax=Streptomyces sp. NPDC006512 TaxID=3154307 RepID=UPI0033BBBB2F